MAGSAARRRRGAREPAGGGHASEGEASGGPSGAAHSARALGGAAAAASAALALLLRANCIAGEFVFDDHVAVVGNGDVTGAAPLTGLLLNDFWGTPVNSSGSHKSYRPLSVLALRGVHGCCSSPWCFRAVNTVLHAGCAALVCLLAQSLLPLAAPNPAARGSCVTWSLMAAAAFAAHPCAAEPVSCAVGLGDLLSALLALGALLCTLRGWGPAAAPGALLCGAGLAKETGMAVLPAVVAAEWRPGGPRRVMAAAWAALGVAALAALRLWATGGRPMLHGMRRIDNPLAFADSPAERWLSTARVWAEYLRLLVFPWRLSCDYSFDAVPMVRSFADPGAAWGCFACAVGAAVCAAALLAARWAAVVLLALALGSFAPASHVFFFPGTLIAERLLYLPAAAAAVLAAAGLQRAGGRRPALALGVAAAGVALLALRTWTRNAEWLTQLAVFTAAEQSVPGSAKVQLNLGVALYNAPDAEGALRRLQRAEQLAPEMCQVHYWLGRLALARGLEGVQEALGRFRRALDCKEREHDRFAREAMEQTYLELIRVGRDSAGVRTDLAAVLLLQGREREAEQQLDKALQLAPGFPAALINAAQLRTQQGRGAEAAQLLRQVRGDPQLEARAAALLQQVGRS